MIAGIAGALLTQTNQFVGLNVLGFEPSGELLVMLILGGVGRLYGAFVGPVVYLIAQDLLAKQFPEYWYFGIGAHAGAGGAVRARRHPRHRRRARRPRARPAMSAVLETRGLCKSFGALTVAESIDFRLEPGARHALIGPNGAGKTTFVNMLTGRLAPSAGQMLLGGEDITGLAQAARVKRGLGRTFQINTLFRDMSVLDNVALGVAERHGIAARLWHPASSHRQVREEARELLVALGVGDDAGTRAGPALRQATPGRDRDCVGTQAQGAAAG